MNGFAERADEAGEIADPCRKHRLDALAHAARHHGRSAAGADGNNDIAAIDDGGKDESGMREVVHHIDGQPDRLCTRRHSDTDITRTRAEDRDHSFKIGRQRIALRDIDACGFLGSKPGQIMIAVGRMPAHPRARRNQQAQFCAREIACADQEHWSALQIEEDWQKSHGSSLSPLRG